MKLFKVGLITGAIALFGVTHAQGATWSLVKGIYSKQSGAQHETFDSSSVDPKEALDLSWSGARGSILGATNVSTHCFQPGSAGNFMCIGRGGAVTFDLSATPADYYGFRWGSIDWFNTVSVYSGDEQLLKLTGTEVAPQKGGGYFQVFAESGESITRVVLETSRRSFESDNHAVSFQPSALALVSAVPEPSTVGLLLAGLGCLIVVGRRRLDSSIRCSK